MLGLAHERGDSLLELNTPIGLDGLCALMYNSAMILWSDNIRTRCRRLSIAGRASALIWTSKMRRIHSSDLRSSAPINQTMQYRDSRGIAARQKAEALTDYRDIDYGSDDRFDRLRC